MTNSQAPFWDRVVHTDGCWEWTGPKFTSTGYGRVSAGEHMRYTAHRMAWELAFGAIPDEMFVLHRCDNPPCVRPDHLFLGTKRDNMLDCIAKGRYSSPRVSLPGERNGHSKLKAEQVAEIRRRYADGERVRHIARDFGISDVHAGRIAHNVVWRS